MAAAQNQRLAVKQPTLRIIPQVQRHHVRPTLVVNVVQSGIRNGYKLRLVVRRARRFCKPFHQPGPEHILLSVAHAVDIALEFLVGIEGNVFRKVAVATYPAKEMAPPVLGFTTFPHEIPQHILLKPVGVCIMFFQLLLARQEQFSSYFCQAHIGAIYQFKCTNLP